MNNYLDEHGRYHIKPVTVKNPYPTNNAYIYSFYAKVVGLGVNLSPEVKQQLLNIDEVALTRHPGGYHVPISHDEYVGAAGLDQLYAQGIVQYGVYNHWQFCDLQGFKSKSFGDITLGEIVDIIKSYRSLLREDNPRKATLLYPAIWNFAFWHQPQHQYFYYRCAGRSPGFARSLWFIIASLISIFRKDKNSPVFGFKMLNLKKLGPTFIEKVLIKLFDKYGKFKETCATYFPEDHPILKKLI